jgi:hypothetical protein
LEPKPYDEGNSHTLATSVKQIAGIFKDNMAEDEGQVHDIVA